MHRLTSFLGAALLVGHGPLLAQTAAPAAERGFALEVKPLLAQKCFACHGQDTDNIRADLDLTSLDGMLKGGESSQPALVPGNARASRLYIALLRSDADLAAMPPKEADRLTQDDVWKIRDWIDAGAPWPDIETERRYLAEARQTEGGVVVATSGGLSEDWTNRSYRARDLWAFRPLDVVEPPPSHTEHPIDAFVDRRLADASIEAAPRADRRTLIRRATYDLTGLPPTPAEVRDFVVDDSPNAWNRVIDRLLASPHYGEQWGLHWLDVVRYADTAGYSNDWERSNAWRYRDYVVRSLNEDKPYDRFILEQIAGDELDPDDPEMLVATGFLRMGPWEHTAMTQFLVSRQLYLDDVTHNVGQTFLSLPLRCAKCHDHKFDPIPTRDYYRFYSVFATTQLAEREAPFLDAENRNHFDAEQTRLERLEAEAEADVAKIELKEEAAARAWCVDRGMPYQPREQLRDKPEGEKPPRHIGLTVDDQGYRKVREADARIWRRRLERYQPLAHAVYGGPVKYEDSQRLRMPAPEKRQGEPPETFIFAGGSVFSPGEKVVPGVLSAVPARFDPVAEEAAPQIPATMSGRRLVLARWIADAQNPLTARSIVNRIWQYHFGRGLAENTNNLGKMGKKPTHPELLDWLARRFLEDGWSWKAMHRLVMSSEVYQRGDRPRDPAAVAETDPRNELLSFFAPRRLTAEEIRDSMLQASGELNPEIGGLSVFPEINREFAAQPRMNQFTLAPAYQPSRLAAQRNRRSLYVYRMRTAADPMFEVFNQPSTDLSCERRDSSTVTPQVFTLLHGESSIDRSIAMAKRLESEGGNLEDQLGRAFELILGRRATVDEHGRMSTYVREMAHYHRLHPPERIEPPRELDREVVEEMSGLALRYKERLDVYDDYDPHTKPWDVGPATRALADVCLTLFNTNEFAYVY
ncbi:MAG: PSD1 and planctomycete cytochrome C domain-containing protein [Acidobacteriota bacterium]|nr:PSD1 and planctomycete cytochrome C domain-containing protein [Acidobacteriota bacterium]